MKFAHMADCHLGGWRDPKMREVGINAFKLAVQTCVDEKVDFVLICGDLFNTAIPGIDVIKEAIIQFKLLRKNGIQIYLIPGSHDFSPTGKTVLDILEEAELCKNVFKGKVVDGSLVLKFTEDEKTGVKLTGILGKRGSLEKSYYEVLDLVSLENEPGEKIFLFHSPIEEYKEKHLHMMEALPISSFPKGFKYYAGGHVHTVMNREEKGYGKFVYPGPIFPNSFSEVEELRGGGFYIVEDNNVRRINLNLKPIESFTIDCDGLASIEVSEKLLDVCNELEVKDKIVLMRIEGKLRAGSIADIRFRQAMELLNSKGAYFVMRNTRGLESIELEEINTGIENVDEIELDVIKEHASQIKLDTDEKEFFLRLLDILSQEKSEGEIQSEFESRIITDSKAVLPESYR